MTAAEAMRLALNEARLAFEEGEVPVGAVVLRGEEAIACAHNACEARHDATAHAEMLALRWASAAIGDWRLDGCTLVVTLEPCAMCAGAIANARLGRLIYGAFDPNFGACGSAMQLLDGGLGWQVAQVGGILEAECRALLDAHFRALRGRMDAD